MASPCLHLFTWRVWRGQEQSNPHVRSALPMAAFPHWARCGPPGPTQWSSEQANSSAAQACAVVGTPGSPSMHSGHLMSLPQHMLTPAAGEPMGCILTGWLAVSRGMAMSGCGYVVGVVASRGMAVLGHGYSTPKVEIMSMSLLLAITTFLEYFSYRTFLLLKQ